MCDSCEVLYINGVKCHEHGCPEAWKDYNREYKWCGSEFSPDTVNQVFCDNECALSYCN